MDAGAQGAGSSAPGGLEELMDEYLRSQGFYRKKIAKDGSCLFRAVAEQVLRCQSRHTEVRATCVQYLKSNRSKYESFIEGDFDEYLKRLEDPQVTSALPHDFIIFQEPGKPPVNITENSFSDKVRLCFLNGNHYDSVYPREFINVAALCQSILYELLYEKVCRVDRSVVASCMEASGKANEEVAAECRSSDESDLEEEEMFWHVKINIAFASPLQASGKLQPPVLSARVQMSLNPFTFRNVEYDVWLRSKRAQQKRDFCIAAGMQYVAGDKCKVRLDKTGQMYSAYVQEVSPNNGPVTVFIEELGQKHSVSLWNLRPPGDDPHAWNTVAEKGKRQALANGTWESRGKKSSAKVQSPTVQNAPRVAHSRMQKQNSWSLQAQTFTEEQALPRVQNICCIAILMLSCPPLYRAYCVFGGHY
uniref:ubiquitinyl hydrolase 1 n=1 Tax=Scleropages formosus TaxID=113540 RepID=A0A8C9RES1_SCLFO